MCHHLDLDVLLPRRIIDRIERQLAGGAGVIDEDVDAPEALYHLFDEARHIVGLGRIGSHGEHLGAEFPDFAGGFLQHLGAARANRDIDAFFCQSESDALADTFAAAGNCGNLPLQAQLHVLFLRDLTRPERYCNRSGTAAKRMSAETR